MSNKKYVMVIDQRRCVGCHTCAVACKSENNMPNGSTQVLNKVITEGSGFADVPYGRPLTTMCDLATFNRDSGTLRLDYLTRSCQHCADAPCVKVCPTIGTTQRADGIVAQDTENCIGCLLCTHECPYEIGAMRVYTDDPQFYVDNKTRTGAQEIAPTIKKTVKKCTFCAHRVDKGEEPFCVHNCPARARFFGDINDSLSEVYRLTHGQNPGNRSVKHGFEVRQGYAVPESSVYFIRQK